ncbi:MAG: hypothetical protein GF344_03490 [Chitinivibrionales bacterium]|nr:hypothetical protein [Chitinivibrionales bacterium]MBD3356134.1 hypothetical protein [Chitinivibrionales bacterium]
MRRTAHFKYYRFAGYADCAVTAAGTSNAPATALSGRFSAEQIQFMYYVSSGRVVYQPPPLYPELVEWKRKKGKTTEEK